MSLQILLLSLVAFASAAAKQPLEQIERKDYPVTANVALTLRLADGTVHIYGSDQNVIKLTAIKKAYTQERLDQIKVGVTVNGDAATIETTFPANPGGLSLADRSGTVDYVLLVPQTCTIKLLEVENGEVIVEGLRGDGVNVRLTNGRILAKNCFTTTDLTLARGGVEVAFYWWESRAFDVKAQSTSGDVHVALPKNANARFDAATGDGWIRNQFVKDETNGDARALQWTMGEEAANTITLRAQSGNIRIENIY
ncbi:MAG: DUF4097 domain-containing protein [Verrucomicrobiota bacterium]|nr:DUF4097 domain-containing protein [Verrucomicrobiota bacterium]